jgi:peptide/nickel transport system substrate-binding protein
VDFGERGDLEPVLATQWTVSRGGTVWTFRLRPDIRLSNGARLTTDDVVASLASRVSADEPPEGAAPWAAILRGASRLVRDVRHGDPGTVQIELSQPFAPILALLAHPALAIAVALPDGEPRALGTGPYRAVERGPGRLILEATPGRGEAARAPRVVFHEIPDDAAGLAGLAPGGDLDVYLSQAPPAWSALGLQALSVSSGRVGFLSLRTDHALLSRKTVRQAVATGLDPALVRPALGRWATPFASYLPPGAWAGRESHFPAYDPARARRLLAQAGATSPRVSLLTGEAPTGVDLPRLAEAMRLSLQTAGFDVAVRTESGDVARRMMREGDTELALFEATLTANDPHFFLGSLLSSDAAVVGRATNIAFFRSPPVDGMLLRASQLGFRPERLRLYQRLQVHVAEEVPYLPVYARRQWLLARPGVRDLAADGRGIVRLERAWVEEVPR